MARSHMEEQPVHPTVSGRSKRGVALATLISGLLLGFTLTINAHAQSPAAPAPAEVTGTPATGYYIKFKVKRGKNAEFVKAISEMMTGVHDKEPGNIYCDLLQLPEDSQTYVVIERYKDVESARAHAESAHIQKLGAALMNGLLDGPPERQDLVFIRSK